MVMGATMTNHQQEQSPIPTKIEHLREEVYRLRLDNDRLVKKVQRQHKQIVTLRREIQDMERG